ncbi:hypothetical protein P152DRAFT_461474 [Eremomyces bilateralis CBS 781.70]|uniref:Uncharacterized protein n=1 Tax=Eremomyces bilateralis CBS 781.70 TaxID=1392243 RepID=A0A6G1FUF7_9PEZI|nr:uncharacterized protein P152DRAFT_461474 [Eremomyces bilateralis CBS 781.70]KAF1809525.1 hypothetical protein P152DRAFT_461474 [Eremomyces bilateralis CBS 781.70]
MSSQRQEMKISAAAVIAICITTAIMFCVLLAGIDKLFRPHDDDDESPLRRPEKVQLDYMAQIKEKNNQAAYRNFMCDLAEDADPSLLNARYFQEWGERNRMFRPFRAERDWQPPRSWDVRGSTVAPMSYWSVRVVRLQFGKGKGRASRATWGTWTTGSAHMSGTPRTSGVPEMPEEVPSDATPSRPGTPTPGIPGAKTPVKSEVSSSGTPAASGIPILDNNSIGESSSTSRSTDVASISTGSSEGGTFLLKRALIPRSVQLAYGMVPGPVVIRPRDSMLGLIESGRRSGLGTHATIDDESEVEAYFDHGKVTADDIEIKQRARELELFGTTL